MKKKSKFLTFMFSMMPGAGHMYLGFMKLGVSIMACFFAFAFLSMSLNLTPILFTIPVIWFYSFFDALNKNGLSDEEFYALEDHFIFNLDENDFKDFHLGKFRLLVAAVLIIIGANLLLSNLMDALGHFLPESFYYALQYFVHILPEIFIGIFIIFIGIKLIIGKNSELKKDGLQIMESEEPIHDENA